VSLDPEPTYYHTVLYGKEYTEDTWMGTEGGADCWCSDPYNKSTCSSSIYGMTNESFYVGRNFGGLPTLYNGIEADSGGDHKQDILLRFWADLVIPSEQVIDGETYSIVVDNATIRLTHRKTSLDAGQLDDFQYRVSMYQMLRNWVEGGAGQIAGICPNNIAEYTDWTTNKYAIFPTETWGNYGSRGREPASMPGVDRAATPMDVKYVNKNTVNVDDCFSYAAINTCPKFYWHVDPKVAENWIKNASSNFGVIFDPEKLNPESHGSEQNWFSSERSEYAEITQPQLIIDYHYEPVNNSGNQSQNTTPQTSKGGLIKVGGGTPFYTDNANPQTIFLNQSQCANVTWNVNSTGEENGSYLFFAFANITSHPEINNVTGKVNITIISGEAANQSNQSNGTTPPEPLNFLFMDLFSNGILNIISYEWNGTIHFLNQTSPYNWFVNETDVRNGSYTFKVTLRIGNNLPK
jgi:hypothetical protein